MFRRRLSGFIIAISCIVAPLHAAVPDINASSSTIYTVRWGDTLARLAHRFYGDGKQYPAIAQANNLLSPHRIIAGQVLRIPASPVAALPPAPAQPDLASVVPVVSSETVPAPQPAAAPEASAAPIEDLAPFVWRTEPFTFEAGEKLTFAVRWKFITVGYATMMINGVEDLDGRKAYHIVTNARSAPFFDTFYRVRDVNESWIDVQSLCSLKYASHTDENNNKKDETILLNHEKREFRIVESSKTGTISPWVQDVLSSLYYLRTKELTVGKSYSFDAHSGDQSWPLTVNVLRTEKIKVPAGEFTCYVVEPAIREGAGIFQAKGKLWVWLTADDRHVPVLMRSKIAVGSIEALLTKMEIPG